MVDDSNRDAIQRAFDKDFKAMTLPQQIALTEFLNKKSFNKKEEQDLNFFFDKYNTCVEHGPPEDAETMEEV